MPQPRELLLDVMGTPDISGSYSALQQATIASLEKELTEELKNSKLLVRIASTGGDGSGATVLRVIVTAADPGDAAKRLIIGFGAGRAEVQVRADLEQVGSRSDRRELVAFTTYSDTGHKPGLLLPGGAALATGDVVHLAVGGSLVVVGNTRSGLNQPIHRTARAIVAQLKAFYAAAGWIWPSGSGA